MSNLIAASTKNKGKFAMASSMTLSGSDSVSIDVADNVTAADDDVSRSVVVPPDSVGDILDTREWIEGQLHEQLCHLGSDKADVVESQDIEAARTSLSKLQAELLHETSKLSAKELTLKRLQLGSALAKEVFAPVPHSDSEDNESRKELEELLLTQRQLASDILKETSELEPLRNQLKAIREKNFEMKAKNRKSMNQIRQRQNTLEEKADDFRKHKEGQRKKEQLEDELKKIVILRHTLQGLILGSGINWAQDTATEELLLSLGEPLNF